MNRFHHRKSGSALLVTLLVVSLLLVVVVTFSAYVRLELNNQSERQDKAMARANARLALNIALAQLQEAAGPDQRVTARAEILGNGTAEPSGKFWTGVWTQDATGELNPDPTWLVSGISPSPETGPGPNAFAIFPANASMPEVEVPLVPIQVNSTLTGEYAFWTADEGVKASAIARRGAIPVYEYATLNPQRRTAEFQSDFGVDLSPFFETPTLDLTDTSLPSILERVSHIRDLPMTVDSSGIPLQPASTIHDHAHELTLLSMGVLENPVDGGLKRNLSDPNFRDTFLATDELQRFLEPKGDFLPVDFDNPADRGVVEGQPFFGPRPLLTEAVLYMGVFQTWSDAKLRIRYHFEAEFTNPYSLPLRFPPDFHGSYNRGLVLYFDNLPTLTARDLTPGTPVPVITEDLNEFSAYSASDSRRYLNSWFEISPHSASNTPELLAGEVYRVMEPNPVTQSRGLARDFGTVRWSGNQNTRPSDTADIEVSAVHPPEGISLRVVPFSESGNPRNRTPVMSFEGLQFDDFSTQRIFRDGPNPFSRPTSASYLQEDYNIAYHFRIGSDAADTTSMLDILTAVDLRDPNFSTSENFVDLEGNTKSKATLLDPIYTDPSYIVSDDASLFSELDQLTDGTARSHAPDFVPALLYDIPDGDTLSVGQLSSLHIYKRAPRSIGNPWGGDYNHAFDRYYFSPRLTSPLTNTNISANPALLDIGDSPATTPLANRAPYEMTLGHFNLNSTSAAAWEAVLAGPILTPTALDETAGPDLARPATFLRLPQHQSRNDDFFVTDDELSDSDNAFAQGIRSLNGTEGREQLRELAQNIVRELKLRAAPFTTVSEFVNSGILQKAIDDVGTYETDDVDTDEVPPRTSPINEGLFEYSNVYLIQSDLLTKLAPYASTRSDTFKIRTFGSVTDPNGNRISTAYLEAVVQRIPGKVDGSDPLMPSTSLADSRTFKIISFRWLPNEDS